jgi:DNA-binding MarR family transcriptional regulator
MATKAGREAWLTMVDLWFLDGHAHDRILDVAFELGLPPGMLKALTFLASPDGIDDESGIRMGDLAEQWGCDASYVTTLTDGLEQRGLAERRPLPRDRRVKTVALTAAGTATLARAMELLSEPPAFLDALSATEQRTLRDLLRKIASVDRSGEPVGTAVRATA